MLEEKNAVGVVVGLNHVDASCSDVVYEHLVDALALPVYVRLCIRTGQRGCVVQMIKVWILWIR